MVRNPMPKHGLGSSPFARRYSGDRCFFLFLRLLRCFSSPGHLLYSYVFTIRYIHITVCGFPHSEICGSKVICTSPQLIAACHVLLRLLLPRHPPYALISLIQINACLLSTLLRCCSVDPMLTYSGMLRFVLLRAPCTANKILRIIYFRF